MSRRSDELLVADIQEAIEKILRYTEGMDEAAFAKSDVIVDAVIRNVEVIGEVASKFSDQYILSHTDVPIHQMTGIRNRLIHAYFGISLSILWRVVKEDLPPLQTKL